MLYFVIIAMLLLFVLFSPLYIVIEYTRDAANNDFKLKIEYLGITIRAKSRKKGKKKEQEKNQNEDKLSFAKFKSQMDGYVDKFQEIREDVFNVIDFLSRKGVRIKLIDIDLDFGFTDAMSTGIMTGIFNGIAYNAVSVLDHMFFVNDWNINIQPYFNDPRFEVRVRGILKIKNVHIIIMIIKIMRVYFKFSKKVSVK
ncbi:MAG: DUF2953 domain-containing protein [Clostridia bacterium]|nr:DUF2953 domain-containing protein [Clostridia bacterium]